MIEELHEAFDDEDAMMLEDRAVATKAFKQYLLRINPGELYSLLRRMDRHTLNDVVPHKRFPCWDIMQNLWWNYKHEHIKWTPKQADAITNVMAFYLWKYEDFGLRDELGLDNQNAIQHYALEGEF